MANHTTTDGWLVAAGPDDPYQDNLFLMKIRKSLIINKK
jgi:hypothetical protein